MNNKTIVLLDKQIINLMMYHRTKDQAEKGIFLEQLKDCQFFVFNYVNKNYKNCDVYIGLKNNFDSVEELFEYENNPIKQICNKMYIPADVNKKTLENWKLRIAEKLKSDYSFKKISNAIVKFYKFNNKTYNAFSAQSI